MATLASEVINKARIDLVDVIVTPATDGVRWLNADMLGYLNEAQVMVVLLKPAASIVTADVALVAGYRQALPSGGLSAVRFGGNVPGGTVPAKSTPEVMDGIMPGWRGYAAAAKVSYVLYSAAEPKIFMTYPPQPASTAQKLEVVYVALPATISAISSAITLADEYVPALIDYLLYRAFAKDSEIPDSLARSQAALGGFAAKIGVPAAQVAKRRSEAPAAPQ
jgi:hypothetical protein